MSFSWTGRQLDSVTKDGVTTTYTYDSNGLRTSKTTGDDVTEYTYLGSSLVYQVTNKGQSDEESLYFYYDEAGIAAFSYKSAEHPTDNGLYYYIRNPQGDILGIVDRTGTLIARYDYSAYGEYKLVWVPEEVPSAQIQRNNRVRNANPFDYRGYYYDTETGLYYCQSRYYDPEVDRWLNVDNQLSGISGDIKGYNLFVYCFNDPVNLSDTSGNWPRWITKTVAAVASVVAVVAIVVAAPAVAIAATAVAAVATITYVAQSHHYDKRKEKNIDLPQTRQEAKDLGWYGPDTTPKGPAADCHQYTAKDEPNVKYVSPDGHREVIYNSDNEIVLDSRDIGTYNFSPSGTVLGSIGHFFVDMVPWYLFGNDADDPGPLINEIIHLFE